MMKNEKVVIARNMGNKNLKADSHVDKWSGVEDLWKGLYSDGLFFVVFSSQFLVLDFGFNALNIIFWVMGKHIPVKNKSISKKKKRKKANMIQ